MTAPRSPALPERLRSGTRDLHAATERSGAMATLLAGRLPRAGYAAMLRNLQALYVALEAALQTRRADAAVARLLQALPPAALARADALAHDLVVIHGPDWAAAHALQPATVAYVDRLQALARNGGPALPAHAYVRYLGDLHGGQLLQRLVAQRLGLTGGAGTRFYDFGPEPEVLATRAALRAALADLPLDDAAQDAVVAEARWAFMQHQRLFEQLDLAGAARSAAV